jgi:hypothetical protein
MCNVAAGVRYEDEEVEPSADASHLLRLQVVRWTVLTKSSNGLLSMCFELLSVLCTKGNRPMLAFRHVRTHENT